MNKEKSLNNQSLIKGLALLEILSNFPNGCPLAKLSELADLNKSTTYRMLQSLLISGFVKQASMQGSYRLTTKCLSIGQKTLSSLNIINLAAPILNNLNLDIGDTVNFSILEQDHAILIYKLEPTTGLMRTRAHLGQRLELYCSAMGKVFLAYASPDKTTLYWQQNSALLHKLTKNTITNLDDMFNELKEIKHNGFAMDDEENEIGVSCIACPIFDVNNNVIYSVSISLSTIKFKQLGKAFLLNNLKHAANEISKELGATTLLP